MSKIKLGVLFECTGDLKTSILLLKSHFLKNRIESKYLDHFAHLTFYVFETVSSNLKTVIDSFSTIKQDFNSFDISISGLNVFEEDILTGLNTLHYEVEKSNNLNQLQLQIVESLCPYVKVNEMKNFKGNFHQSYRKWGYPFVGDLWIPHITIGSVDMPKNELIDQASKFRTTTITEFDNLSLFLIDGDNHTLLHKIKPKK